MPVDFIDYEGFFGFEPEELSLDINFTFNSKFKIIDSNGYKLHMHKIYKRSLSKDNFQILDKLILENFPLFINDVSGLDIKDFHINKLYDGVFELSYFIDKTFDINFVGLLEKV